MKQIERAATLCDIIRCAIGILTAVIMLSGCTGSVTPAQNKTAQALSIKAASDCSAGQCSCDSPTGPFASGASVTVYSTAQVACGQTCDTQALSIKCNNGVWSQDITKLNFACSVAACSACALGINLINDGGSMTAYNTAQVDCGDTCAAHTLTRVCNNGVLSGDGSYNQTNCQPSSCECQLPDNTGFLTLGGAMKFYSTTQAACGQTCDSLSQIRTCGSQGTGASRTYSWSGQSSFKYSGCTNPDPKVCQCTLPNNLGTIATGQSIMLSSSPTAQCTPCAQLAGENVTCAAGALVDSATKLAANPASKGYVYTCVDQGCTQCLIPGYGSINSGTTLTLFSAQSYGCGVLPSTVTYNFSCNGTTLRRDGLPYTASGTPTWYTSLNSNCVGCVSPWGEAYPTGTPVTMYKVNVFASGSCGQSCSSQVRTCLASGSFDGDSTFSQQQCYASTCSQQGGGAPPRTCLLPWQNSFVTPGAQIPMWRKKTVACGDSCQNYFKLGTCQISTGTFDAGFAYIYPACTEVCP